MQLTGSVLGTSSEEETQKMLTEAMAGKEIILVLDDLWDPAHETPFNFIDADTTSRVLISSRVKGSIDSCELVEIGMPSEEDAQKMLLASAGLETTDEVPQAAVEIVRLCKRLPLTVNIAGRLLKDMSLQGDWDGVLEMIRDEFDAGGEMRSAEDNLIKTSLRSIQGPHAEGARSLFKCFGLAPEDSSVPLEALAFMFQAQHGSGKPIALKQIRRWLKMLIDRNLVLPPLDQPSLHDILLDFSMSMHTVEELQAAHRNMIELFREQRPVRDVAMRDATVLCDVSGYNRGGTLGVDELRALFEKCGTSSRVSCVVGVTLSKTLALITFTSSNISFRALGTGSEEAEKLQAQGLVCSSTDLTNPKQARVPSTMIRKHEATLRASGISIDGLCGWDREMATVDKLSKYVFTEMEHHVRCAWATDEWDEDEQAITWLDDFTGQQDALPVACARFLGPERVQQLAERAQENGDWWAAGLRWSAAAKSLRGTSGTGSGREQLIACVAALEQAENTFERDQVMCSNIILIIKMFNPVDLPVYKPRLDALIESGAASTSAEAVFTVMIMIEFYPKLLVEHNGVSGSEIALGKQCIKMANFCNDVASNELPGTENRAIYLNMAVCFNWVMLDCCARCPDFNYEGIFGEKGALLIEAAETYELSMHERIYECIQFDPMLSGWGHGFPLFAHWGNLSAAGKTMDKTLECLQGFIQAPSADGSMDMVWAACHLPQGLYLCNRHEEGLELLRSLGCDWSRVGDTLDRWAEKMPWLRARAEDAEGGFCEVKSLEWHFKEMWVLLSKGLPSGGNVDDMPDADTLSSFGQLTPGHDGGRGHHHGNFCAHCSPTWGALMLELLGQPKKALTYVKKGLDPDSSIGGDSNLWVNSLAYRCRGRILATQGSVSDAEEAFESAVKVSRQGQYHMLELLAVHDLNTHVLTPAGRSREGQQRAVALFGRLASSKDAVQQLLAGGRI
eukprot:COSAG02_NODE_1359_length_13055_cov_31.608397_5_plen_963_part_00